MNKRNTEGYVLAYLLIVITVMGVIAATLMTSTLQVVQAQEKSLVYMKDKYEAMGEIEKSVAELEHDLKSTTPSEGLAYFSASQLSTYDAALNGAIGQITALLSATSEKNYVLELTSPSASLDVYTGDYSFTFVSEGDLISVTSTYHMPFSLKVITHTYPPYLDTETNTEITPSPDYDYQMVVHSLTASSYTVSAFGGEA